MSNPTGRRAVLLGSYAPSLVTFRGPLIAAMAERGHEVFALAPDIDSDTADRVRALGATPVSIPLGRTSLNPWASWKSVGALRSLLSEIGPDVVVAYTIKPIVLGAAAAKAAGVPRFVAMVTGLGYAFLGGRSPKRLAVRLAASLMYRRAFRLSHFAIFQNPDDLADFRRLGLLPRRLGTGLVNGSGIDLEAFAQKPLPERPCFLMVARFLRDKGISEYAEAAARLQSEYPHVRVALVGWLDESPDSIRRSELEAMDAAGIENLGKLDDVRPALEACSVYVLPSYREGTPRSVLEAMAVGRPIVTTDVPGCRETVVEGENGFLVPARDSGALYRAMKRFVERPELCAPMGAASRRIAESKYDVHSVNRRILDYAGL
jgi:glycosyltransferase involved in cell wall biosynthesis